MECPFCSSLQLVVVNSRPNFRLHGVWRRRKCLKCLKVFTTSEIPDLSMKRVLKKSGKTQLFDRARLYLGIYRAASESRDLSLSESRKVVELVMSRVERILLTKDDILTSHEIGEAVLSELKKTSWQAFLRFLAYYDPERIKRGLS